MRALFTAAFFLAAAYLVYVDAPSRLIFASVFLYLAGYLVICFLEDFLTEFRKERDKNND